MTTIDTVLTRGVSSVIVEQDLEKKLKKGTPLRIKLGIDPTGSDLTLGHAVVLRKLQQFKDLGHHIILLFGDFTAQIGDPSGKSKTRPPLSAAEIAAHEKTYLEQAARILDLEGVEVRHNSEWLEKMGFKEVLELASTFSVQQMMERDMFQQRVSVGRDINITEFLYPLMQGYDSVALKADVEIGGNDQYFNLLCARPIQEHFGMPPQNVLTTQLLVGTDGKEKMSKSLGNYVRLLDPPAEIFGKIMSLPDTAMATYFECITDEDSADFSDWIKSDPRGAKIKLAQLVVTLLHDQFSAEKCLTDWEEKFVAKKIPTNAETFPVSQGANWVMVVSEIQEISRSAATRLIQQGAVSWQNEKVTDPQATISCPAEGGIVKIGKHCWRRLIDKK